MTGTVLRNGDTLTVMFAIEKNSEPGLRKGGLDESEVDGTMKDVSYEPDEMTANVSRKPSSLRAGVKNLLPGSQKSSGSWVPNEHERQRHERKLAIELLQKMCIQRLRQTNLQVRVIIQVIHCEDVPNALLQAIDECQPSLVIVGSRGLSKVSNFLSCFFLRFWIVLRHLVLSTT